ncbi:MAG: type II toxin-antitoxin system VapC family toxin [Candidatus Acidiferrales bacterium]
MAAVLDTHAAIWYVFIRKRLSQDALRFIRRAIDSGKPAYVSAISLVETIYLVERGRVPLEAIQRLENGLKDPASGLLVAPVDSDVAEAVHRVPPRHCSRHARPHHRSHGASPGLAPCHPRPANSIRRDKNDLVN